MLAEIASDTGIKQNISEKGDGGAQISGPATGASGGEAYRDPFAPDFWSQQVAFPSEAEAGAEPEKTSASAPGKIVEPAPEKAVEPAPERMNAIAPPAKSNAAAHPAAQAEKVDASPPPPIGKPPEPSKATEKAADRIRRELAEALLRATG